ncbi:MAG: isocitrate lyase/phosphoenolpyruvate mutase family protein, partial [Polyangiaceae bacterium]
FVIPNPWDVGSARILEQLKFKALATSSSGFAFTEGLPDPVLGPGDEWVGRRDRTLAHLRAIVDGTELPVNADFQSGFARDLEGLSDSVRRCVETGVAGLSIEDASGVPGQPLFSLEESVERIKVARAAIDKTKSDVLLTARAECFLVDHPEPLRESILRLEAYAEAGADVLFAPGARTREEITAIVRAVAPRPVNLLVSTNTGLTVADVAALGVRRISVGSALARVAWGAFVKAARELAGQGSFNGLTGGIPFTEINGLFAKDR